MFYYLETKIKTGEWSIEIDFKMDAKSSLSSKVFVE